MDRKKAVASSLLVGINDWKTRLVIFLRMITRSGRKPAESFFTKSINGIMWTINILIILSTWVAEILNFGEFMDGADGTYHPESS